MTLTLSAKPATTLLISNRDSVRRVSGFVLTAYPEITQNFANSQYGVTGADALIVG